MYIHFSLKTANWFTYLEIQQMLPKIAKITLLKKSKTRKCLNTESELWPGVLSSFFVTIKDDTKYNQLDIEQNSALEYLQTNKNFPHIIKPITCSRVTIHVGLFTLEPGLLPPTAPLVKWRVVVKLRNARSDIKRSFYLCNLHQASSSISIGKTQ